MQQLNRLRTLSLWCLIVSLAGVFNLTSAQVSSSLINSTNAAIDTIRKRNCTITVTGSNGLPLSGVTVSVKQISHHFGFGAAIPYSILNDTNLQKVFLDHFEWAVFENDLKWPSTDTSANGPDYTKPDSLLDWCTAHGIKVRGHCLFWNQDTGRIPAWTRNLSTSAFQAAVDARITNAVTHYKGKLEHWDVANEVIHGTVFETKTGNSNIWSSIFNKVRAIDSTVKLTINDFNIIERYSDADKYITKINAIRATAPIDIIGLEGHFGGDLVQSDYKSKLDKMTTVGLPMWITEMDFSVGMNVRCDRFEELLRTSFANPKMEGFMFWAFWQGNLWRETLTSFIADSATYAINDLGKRYESLLKLWTTTTSGTTDANGKYSFKGFHGNYAVTTTVAGVNQIDTFYLDPAKSVKTITIANKNTDIIVPLTKGSPARTIRINGTPVMITTAHEGNEPVYLSVYSTTGRVLSRHLLSPAKRDIALKLPSGCYLVRVGTGTRDWTGFRISLP